jgi:hypothetical protein
LNTLKFVKDENGLIKIFKDKPQGEKVLETVEKAKNGVFEIIKGLGKRIGRK